jgi:hypothetical protein
MAEFDVGDNFPDVNFLSSWQRNFYQVRPFHSTKGLLYKTFLRS